MKDEKKTKAQLIEELNRLRSRIAELEDPQSQCRQVEVGKKLRR